MMEPLNCHIDCTIHKVCISVSHRVFLGVSTSTIHLQRKGLCHDSAHVWAVTVTDCLWTNRNRVRCKRGNLHNLRLIVREAGVFETFMFYFIHPHNSYLFSGIPQINVADDKNKINNPVLLWNKHLPTCIFMYPR